MQQSMRLKSYGLIPKYMVPRLQNSLRTLNKYYDPLFKDDFIIL